jgi:hypothetical protein
MSDGAAMPPAGWAQPEPHSLAVRACAFVGFVARGVAGRRFSAMPSGHDAAEITASVGETKSTIPKGDLAHTAQYARCHAQGRAG